MVWKEVKAQSKICLPILDFLKESLEDCDTLSALWCHFGKDGLIASLPLCTAVTKSLSSLILSDHSVYLSLNSLLLISQIFARPL